MLTPFEELKPAEGLQVSGLRGTSASFWLSQLLAPSKEPTLILVSSSEQAETLYTDLLFFRPELKDKLHLYLHWESHSYDTLSPHPEVMISRIEMLYRLFENKKLCVIATPEALFQKNIPADVLIEASFFLKKGDEVDRGKLIEKLVLAGYGAVASVEDKGTFCVRGGIVDIFPPLTQHPFRFEFLGDEIESIRTFDPSTQRALKKDIFEVSIIPIREVILSPQAVERAKVQIKKSADENDVPKASRDQLLENLDHRIYFLGIDYLLPFFYERCETFFDYFSETFRLILLDQSTLKNRTEDFEAECQSDYKKALEQKRVTSDVSGFYLSNSQFWKQLKTQRFLNITSLDIQTDQKKISFETSDHSGIRQDFKRLKISSLEILKPLAQKFHTWRDEGYKIYFVAHTQTQLNRFKELFSPYDVTSVELILGALSQGFVFKEKKIVYVTEVEIFGQRKKRVEESTSIKEPFVSSLSEMKVGEPIVHAQHGVGLYRGLKRLKFGENQNDFMLIEYAAKDKLYLPVHRLNVVQKYVGGRKDTLRLDRLGGLSWIKTKRKVKKAIEDIAHELLEIYAQRKLQKGYAFAPADSYFHEMEALFPYDETVDQLTAIEKVLSDMCSEKPMDRLICGDVGYGKTEVAIRAAFKAVLDKKQVALLAPTTLLVDQHRRVFQKRLEKFPVKIEMLSRFRNKKQQKETVEKLKAGKVDIVIGTHRMLSSDVSFRDLGLLIVDEEQRFGVKHKEKIKKMKKTLDILTLSATPIPRTLHMAFLGIRDISIMNTPPQDRLSIRTYLAHFEKETIRNAILKEIRRGGQVFFVHNKVQTIAKLTKNLQKMVPEASFHFAHGQMKESAIEKVMVDFLDNKFNVLVCTTIIGSGIDISSANTIIIDRADHFGLSSLYQLRGRVGRSQQRAYAYLLIPAEKEISVDAKKRLQVIQGAQELGSGFKVASHDLEIRGGGNILGKDQSGQIEAVGFEMYTQLLEEAVREIKGESLDSDIEPEMNLKTHAYISEDYIADMGEKISFYRQLSSIKTEDELHDIEAEMLDRYGKIPKEAYNLFDVMAIQLYLKKLKIKTCNYGNEKVVFTFADETPIQPQVVIQLVEKKPKKFQIRSGNKFIVSLSSWKEILPFVRQFYMEHVG